MDTLSSRGMDVFGRLTQCEGRTLNRLCSLSSEGVAIALVLGSPLSPLTRGVAMSVPAAASDTSNRNRRTPTGRSLKPRFHTEASRCRLGLHQSASGGARRAHGCVRLGCLATHRAAILASSERRRCRLRSAAGLTAEKGLIGFGPNCAFARRWTGTLIRVHRCPCPTSHRIGCSPAYRITRRAR